MKYSFTCFISNMRHLRSFSQIRFLPMSIWPLVNPIWYILIWLHFTFCQEPSLSLQSLLNQASASNSMDRTWLSGVSQHDKDENFREEL